MSKERKIVGIWPSDRISSGVLGVAEPIAQPAAVEPAPPAPPIAEPDPALAVEAEMPSAAAPSDMAEVPDADDNAAWLPDTSDAHVPDRGFAWSAWLIALASLGWGGFVAWSQSSAFTRLPAMDSWPQIAVMIAAPVATILLFALLIAQGSDRAARRHLRTLALIREEQTLMAERLGIIDRHWQSVQRQLMTNVETIEQSSERAGALVSGISSQIGDTMSRVSEQAVVIDRHGETAQRSMDALLVALPKIDEVAQRAIDAMRESGQLAYQFGGQLEAKIAEVRNEAGQAEQSLQQMIGRLADEIAALRQATDDALERGIQLSGAFDQSLANQRTAALALLADLSAALEQQVQGSDARLSALRQSSLDATREQIAQLADAFANGEQQAATMRDTLRSAGSDGEQLGTALVALTHSVRREVADVQQMLEASTAAADERLRALNDSVAALRQSGGLAISDAESFAARADTVVAALAGVRHEIDVTLPSSIAALQTLVSAGREQIDALPERIAVSRSAADAALLQLRAAETSLQTQADLISALEDRATAALTNQTSLAGELQQVLAGLAEQMQSLATRDGAAVTASMEAIDASAQAIITRTAGRLEQALAEALDRATGEAVNERLAQVAAASDQAVAAASAASDRLMRELITIADSSAALEARAAEVAGAISVSQRDTLSRQMATLTEALHSISVDLTRILSTEVADQSWELYLKGDRSIFARRALRLLTSAEAKDTLRRYEEDGEFRTQVNRYIHDFENMLRTVMDARDGAALSVTLLSSDIGKIYVALAQAIERLRH